MTATSAFRSRRLGPGQSQAGATFGASKIRRVLFIALTLSGIYLLLPVVAGAMKHGDRSGPVIYPRSFHEIAFRIGYSLAGHGKPRLSVHQAILFKRPFFYGCRPRLISEEEFELLSRRLTADGRGREAAMLKETYQEFQLLLRE